MQIQRTVPIVIEPDSDLEHTIDVFREVQHALSEPCFNGGKPLGALALQRACYHQVKGSLSAQMTISAIRLVSAAYASAKSNKKPAQRPFLFKKARALFLVGKRGRDADFRKDGTLSLWTVAGRKHLTYTLPQDFETTFMKAIEIDSLTVIKRHGKLIGRVTLTLDAPEPQGILPVGIDLNETNALVAVDPDGRTLFVRGKDVKVKNRRTAKTRARLQRKHAIRKAEKKDTRSIRRLLKRLGRTQRNRTRTFAQQTARQLITFAPENAVLVFEDLHLPKPEKGTLKGKALRRRMSLWQRHLIRTCVENKAQECGLSVTQVNPAYTSKNCSRCGLRGVRKRHAFSCPHCGHRDHADVNAAVNIRNRYTAFRGSGLLSISPEAQS
ncbi:transposase [Ktedonobacter sp. SOSP1-85]|uniref:RNA-guided endonuclease InsQ/TnpB family protein n=1 Tax=Ktedonobacter sp. SOSP1-85 TaxID=2778367 RepID=UPI0019152EAF|nr:RNA-guided endonuclease TnpB family protein [Ktedonobacter sp. SOSP1-85]GHO76885.1 transposase [Ktedonobacter sp. SOSP1-85]